MKFAAVLIAATFAVASAADATVPTCDSAALLKIVQGANGKACSESTGFSAIAAKPVSADNAAKVCPEKSCQALLKEISDAVKTECLVVGVTPLVSGVLKPSEEACAKLANGAAGGAAAAGGSTTGSGVVGDVTVPETTTGAPVSGSSTGSADAATSGSGAESPAAGSVPSPAPSSAVKIAAATSAAAVAVVATLF